MNEELEAALNILHAALQQEQWPLSKAKRNELIALRNRLLHDGKPKDVKSHSLIPFTLLDVEELVRNGVSTTMPIPPPNAEFLFYLFLTPANCDALVGDLEERYKLIYKKFGRRRANFWYWKETLASVGPIVWAWAKKLSLKPVMAVVGWAVAKGVVGHDGWLAAVVELWKRVRS